MDRRPIRGDGGGGGRERRRGRGLRRPLALPLPAGLLHHRRGLGLRAAATSAAPASDELLLAELIEVAGTRGFHTVMARIVGGHDASIGLHRSLGFEHGGRREGSRPQVRALAGRRRDATDAVAPREARPPVSDDPPLRRRSRRPAARRRPRPNYALRRAVVGAHRAWSLVVLVRASVPASARWGSSDGAVGTAPTTVEETTDHRAGGHHHHARLPPPQRPLPAAGLRRSATPPVATGDRRRAAHGVDRSGDSTAQALGQLVRERREGPPGGRRPGRSTRTRPA